jgi:hypothetical protein
MLAVSLLAPRALAAACADAPASPSTRPAETRPDKQQFIRFRGDGHGGGTLDTAITTYRNSAGVVVHLVAAVHVGEPGYYRGLSRTFDTYDALLYELVKSRDGAVPGTTRPTRPGGTRIRGAAAIGGLQSFLRNVLKLDFQLEAINYDRPNFVHADLDAETFNELQEQRGESMVGLMFRSTLRQMRRQFAGEGAPPITALDLLAAMRSPDSARQYKLLLARELSDLEGQLEGLDGEGEDGTVLIAERNKAALRVLERTIADGKHNIGVFYGAGHMRGIQEALVERMGFTRTGVEWRVAWDMREPAKGKQPATRVGD